MAASGKLSSEGKNVLTEISFEDKVKKHIGWSKQDWLNTGLPGNHWNKFISFLKFWNYNLKEAYNDNCIIITLYNEEREAFIEIEKVLEVLQSIIPMEKFAGYFKLRSSKLLGLDFVDKDTAKFVKENLKFVENNNVAFLHWANNNGMIQVGVHWIPRSISKERIIEFLSKYIDIIDIEIEITDFDKMKKVASGKYNIKGKLLNGVQAEDLPHLFHIGRLQGLLTVRGRAPLCLCCEKVGHIVKECPTPYCSVCRNRKPAKHSCSFEKTQKETYANKVKKDNDGYAVYEETLLSDKSPEENKISVIDSNEMKIHKSITKEFSKNVKMNLVEHDVMDSSNKQQYVAEGVDIHNMKDDSECNKKLDPFHNVLQAFPVQSEKFATGFVDFNQESSQEDEYEKIEKNKKRKKPDINIGNDKADPALYRPLKVYGKTGRIVQMKRSDNLYASLKDEYMDDADDGD